MEVRPLSGDDASAIHDALRRWEEFWEVPRATSPERAMEWLLAPSVSLPDDTRSIWIDGELAAYGLVSHSRSDRRFEVAPIFGLVRPDHRGQGLGTDLLSWQTRRAKQRLAMCDPSLPWTVRVSTWDWIEEAHALYERQGFTRTRGFQEMLKPLERREDPDPPAGVAIVPWNGNRDQEVLELNNAAFADHWGAIPMSEGNWKVIVDATETRVDQSFFALAGNDLIGFSLNAFYPGDEEVTGRREGWVRVLAVAREWRGQGVGSSLLRSSFNAFADAGYTHTMIRVDGESLTGAHHVYENLGYRTIRSMSMFDQEVGALPT